MQLFLITRLSPQSPVSAFHKEDEPRENSMDDFA